jgi:hypothetical protein
VLALLDQIDGVERSFANESGTLIQLSLRPGADPQRAVAAASHVLRQQVEDRIALPLSPTEGAAALQREEWRNENQPTTSSVAATMAPKVSPPGGQPGPRPVRRALLGLLLGCLAVGLWLLWRWHRNARVTAYG